MPNEHLGDRIARLRRMSGQTQDELAEAARVSVDVIRKLEQKRKHSARLPTLHSLAAGLGVEVTHLLGDPPALPRNTDAESPGLVAVRRAIMPPLFGAPPEPEQSGLLALPTLREQIADAWSSYHTADFNEVMRVLPGLVSAARLLSSGGTPDQRAAGHGALAKALQLGGHLSVRLGKTDLALASLERAVSAAEQASDPLLTPMMCNSVAWAYQRQNRLGDATELAVRAADRVEHTGPTTSEEVRVWGGLLMSAATSYARSGDYEHANDLMLSAEQAAGRLSRLPAAENGRLVSVFNLSSVRIERVRLAVQHERPEDALALARRVRLSADTPVSWRTWLLLDIARAHTDLGNAAEAVKALETLRRIAPAWMRHHTLAVAIVTDLWAGPARPPGLRKLASFLGIE
ncbi:helix-turn-helix domain-containing protein [Streptomyces sp. LP05-1]|uniref:Helix-turn-helix domain-containing protein n=1 Tax=Streptomyces pyxinae TaxID=2970734 RepID=A0ABT2CTI8_9ACTN|nr:helix-turn-helix domain-containing protein [Streptomyces sp. LP05-1]MCS0639889.1 helix-turn-helix domain-containing protein [Streptomyces sp. LP05-1]